MEEASFSHLPFCAEKEKKLRLHPFYYYLLPKISSAKKEKKKKKKKKKKRKSYFSVHCPQIFIRRRPTPSLSDCLISKLTDNPFTLRRRIHPTGGPPIRAAPIPKSDPLNPFFNFSTTLPFLFM
ncbi:unnamed protein product [Citrullus colocynthis]|uniref:Uncharacterized protein n=1 Tax=Citrullus colocynthis TaxID=252529 RepID=A0ABP0Y5F7_9ROSI